MSFIAVGEVRGVDQAERCGREQLAFLAFARCGFDQLGRVPLAEVDFELLELQPPLEEVDLGGFARSIQPLYGD